MSLRLGIDLRIFHILVDSNGEPVSATEIATQSKAEELLISMCSHSGWVTNNRQI